MSENTTYYEGKGCSCFARSQGECACQGVDWTPSEVYKLRGQAKVKDFRIAELENQWISVEDRLPDFSMQDTTILCGTTSGTCIACVGKDGVFLEEYRGLKLGLKVTHWMPLPESPTARGE